MICVMSFVIFNFKFSLHFIIEPILDSDREYLNCGLKTNLSPSQTMIIFVVLFKYRFIMLNIPSI